MEFVHIYTERLMIRKTIIDDVDLLLKMDQQEVTQLYLGGIKNKSRKEKVLFLKNKINNDNYLVSWKGMFGKKHFEIVEYDNIDKYKNNNKYNIHQF